MIVKHNTAYTLLIDVWKGNIPVETSRISHVVPGATWRSLGGACFCGCCGCSVDVPPIRSLR
jgi:hypothetical protein